MNQFGNFKMWLGSFLKGRQHQLSTSIILYPAFISVTPLNHLCTIISLFLFILPAFLLSSHRIPCPTLNYFSNWHLSSSLASMDSSSYIYKSKGSKLESIYEYMKLLSSWICHQELLFLWPSICVQIILFCFLYS